MQEISPFISVLFPLKLLFGSPRYCIVFATLGSTLGSYVIKYGCQKVLWIRLSGNKTAAGPSQAKISSKFDLNVLRIRAGLLNLPSHLSPYHHHPL